MTANPFRATLRIAAVGLLAPFFLWAQAINECPRGKPTPQSYTWDFVAEANELFNQLESRSQSLIDASDKLVFFSNSPGQVTWHTHAMYLTQAKEDVNEVNEILCRLAIIKPAVERWQADLIDRIHKDGVLAAVHVQAAIDYLNDNRSRVELGVPAYEQQVEAVNQCARGMDDNLDAYTTLAKARERVNALEAEG